jgi:hypothetical protein
LTLNKTQQKSVDFLKVQFCNFYANPDKFRIRTGKTAMVGTGGEGEAASLTFVNLLRPVFLLNKCAFGGALMLFIVKLLHLKWKRRIPIAKRRIYFYHSI